MIASGATVVFCQKGIDDLAQHYHNAGILALRRVIKKDMDKLSKATGSNIVTSLDELKPSDLGTAALVEEKRVGAGIMTFVTGTKSYAVTLCSGWYSTSLERFGESSGRCPTCRSRCYRG